MKNDSNAHTQAAHLVNQSLFVSVIGSLFWLASARRHNLKTHAGTHDRDASKRFVCCTCDSRFSRKHDLHRHREALHTDRTSYASSVSGRRFDLRPDLSQYRTTTVSGDRDGRPMPSLHPGPLSDTGFEDLTARFEHATWLQGA